MIFRQRRLREEILLDAFFVVYFPIVSTYSIKKNEGAITLDKRLEVIEHMRNQEVKGQSRLYQAVHGSAYEEYGSYEYPFSFERKQRNLEQEGKKRGISFKVRLLLAVLIGAGLFSMKGTEQEAMVQQVIQQMEENPTIESVTDQVVTFAVEAKKQFSSPISK